MQREQVSDTVQCQCGEQGSTCCPCAVAVPCTEPCTAPPWSRPWKGIACKAPGQSWLQSLVVQVSVPLLPTTHQPPEADTLGREKDFSAALNLCKGFMCRGVMVSEVLQSCECCVRYRLLKWICVPCHVPSLQGPAQCLGSGCGSLLPADGPGSAL